MTEHRGGSGNFAEDKEKASEAGKKGGQNSGGNFKNDREKASEAGKKGGKNSHRDSWFSTLRDYGKEQGGSMNAINRALLISAVLSLLYSLLAGMVVNLWK